jgi:hypothetical protein
MGKDKYRSSSRSPDRRYQHRGSDNAGEEPSRREHKESHKYRNQSEEERSDDEYDKKKERKRREKELKKREKEKERRREREGDYGEVQQQYASHGGERGTSGYGGPGEYRPQAPSRYDGAYRGDGQYYPPPPSSGYGVGGQQHSTPPPPPPQSYNQAPPQPYGAGGEYQRREEYAYNQPVPSAQYGGPPPGPPPDVYSPPPNTYRYQPPPPPQPHQFYSGHGVYQSQYQPPHGSFQSQGSYQGQYQQSPSTVPPQGSYQSEYKPPSPPTGPPPSTYSGGGSNLGFSSRPQYSTAGAPSSRYKPQAHSSAQDHGEGTGSTYFSGTPTQTTSGQGGSVLDTFTKGLSSSIHNYARTLFPATSTYSPAGIVAPEAKTGNRFESFAPVRNGNGAKWYVDGKDYMYAVSMALEKARETIWILDCMWSLYDSLGMIADLSQGG